ncbi:hypothetical protein JL09_g7027 [Pichia kudriavzevii]|uniref:Uncharacterized protein n=1 Tax=Pichia kudriavzevii TaxID=4909 RepID=A0A099NKA3_PICKU|nr:hypothetical protein JL09_g7027 [Pichia kudriavzevii]
MSQAELSQSREE